MPFAYLKDRFLPEEDCHISIHDRSFRFGDGIFDTCLIANGRMYDFASHLKRVENGLSIYKIKLDTNNIENICNELLAKNAVSNGFTRIIVSRGENIGHSVGYLPKDTCPYLLIQSGERPYPPFKEISLWLSSYSAVLSLPCKTNNAMLYSMALIEAAEYNCENALMVNKDDYICETASGNIFWIKNDILFTPSLDLEIIPGTIRARILELWQGKKREGHFRLEDLQDASEVFMTNIGSLLVPVTNILPYTGSWPVGNITKALRKQLDDDIIQKTSAEIAGK